MKPLLLAILFLIIIIVGSTATLYYVTNKAEELGGQLVKLEEHVDTGNWSKAHELYKDFKKDWVNTDHKWSMLIDHDEIDYINMYLGELEAFIKMKDKANALAKLSTLQHLIEHIPEKEYPSLKNIF